MMGFGLLFILLVIGAIAYAGGWRPQFGQWSQPGGPAGTGSGNKAQEILRERYARGDLSREEYQRMREELKD
jgi:putative membrane protein